VVIVARVRNAWIFLRKSVKEIIIKRKISRRMERNKHDSLRQIKE